MAEETTRFSGKVKKTVFWHRLTRWEYWPFGLLYIPVYFYFTWLAIKCRSFFFFTAANPGIHFGGMLGESKKEIFDLLPKENYPLTLKLSPDISLSQFRKLMEDNALTFPIILKPDIGERGWMVEKINNETDLENYLSKINVDFLIQEYVDYPIELGVFYYRYPDTPRGTISSIVQKDLLSVTGNGRKTVGELIHESPRARMQLEEVEKRNPEILEQVPRHGERIELVSIGNHCRGTTFLNGNHLISEKLIRVFDEISQKIEGFYFGRYDLRCTSVEDLYQGKNIKILELNGAGAEPGHIYQPGYPLMQAYRDIMHHLRVLAEIGSINRKNGIPFMSLRQGLREIRKIRKYNQQKVSW